MTELNTMSVHALSERVEELEQQLAAAEAKKQEAFEHANRHLRDKMRAQEELQRVRSALTWQSVKNGDYWPREGEIYLVKINGVLQHEAYRFETEDSDFGTGKNYWFREDCDEYPLFSPESDEWLPLSALKALASPAAEPDIHCDTLSELRKLGGALGIAMPESLEMMRPSLVKQIIRHTTQLFEQQPAPAAEPASKTGAWSPVTAPGQIGVGSWLCFTVAGRFFCTQAKDVLHPGTDREEVIYNRKRNHYFITLMVLSGSSSHKNVMVANVQPAPATEPGAKGTNSHGLDARYFREKLGQLVRDADNYTPDEMQRALMRLADSAQPAPVAQSEHPQCNCLADFMDGNHLSDCPVAQSEQSQEGEQ